MFKNKEFYHGTIERVTGLVGALFSNLKYVSGRNEDGTNKFSKVNLKYGQNFKTRKDLFDYISRDEKISRNLPIVCFYLTQMSYKSDVARLNNKTIICNGVEVGTPVPYIFTYQFDIISRTNESGYSIMEQILPYFTPSLVLRYRPLKDVDIVTNLVLTLTSPQNATDGNISNEKLFQFQSSFTLNVSGQLFRPVNVDPQGLIEEIIINNKDFDSGQLLESITITSEDL